MNIKRIKLADVKPAAYNPRRQLKPGEKEYEALKASISRWSLVEPLVVNLRTGNLVGGHQRYNVLLDLGHTEAEAAVVDLDEKQEKLLNVALNRIEGQWDYEKLQDLFEEFSAEDIFATGYSDGELKTLFGGEDEDPTASTKMTRSRRKTTTATTPRRTTGNSASTSPSRPGRPQRSGSRARASRGASRGEAGTS